MKHIKISLAVVALILGTGAAFAGKTQTKSDAPCTSTTVCQSNPNVICCFDEQTGLDRTGNKL